MRFGKELHLDGEQRVLFYNGCFRRRYFDSFLKADMDLLESFFDAHADSFPALCLLLREIIAFLIHLRFLLFPHSLN